MIRVGIEGKASKPVRSMFLIPAYDPRAPCRMHPRQESTLYAFYKNEFKRSNVKEKEDQKRTSVV